MTEAITLDTHAHLIPVEPDALAGFDGISWDADEGKMTIDGHTVGIRPIYKPQALLDWMEREAVAHAWISAPPPTYRQHLQGQEAQAWTDFLNAGLAKIATDSGGRLTALPHLPTQAPDVAVAIAVAAGAQGLRAFSMPTGTGDDRTLSDPAFAPLWAALDRIGATVFFHPGSCADGRLKAFYLGNLVGNPHESTVAISHLVLGGILEAHPNLTPVFAHGGGTYPMVADRIQRGFDTDRPGVDTAATRPADLLSRIHVDCICHGPAALALAEQTFGTENVVFGSDWPFPMGLVNPHDQLADVGADRRTRIFGANAAALLKKTTEET